MSHPIAKSTKLANVCYDIRGPVLDKARAMEEEGQKKSSSSTLGIWLFLDWSRPTKSCKT